MSASVQLQNATVKGRTFLGQEFGFTRPVKDITGKGYENSFLVAIKLIGFRLVGTARRRTAVWLWQCSKCGNTCEATINEVSSGNKRSCGCLTRGPRSETVEIIEAANKVLNSEGQMTVRHLYYILVSNGVLKENNLLAYNRLDGITLNARRDGLIDDDLLVDTMRKANWPIRWSGLGEYKDYVRAVYERKLWDAQPYYVVLLFEKDAIVGVLEATADQYGVATIPLHGTGGRAYLYHQVAMPLLPIIKSGKQVYIGYMGDHDPSGYKIEDAAHRELLDILAQYGGEDRDYFDARIHWERIAFLEEDFKKHGIPALDAKEGGGGYKKFKAKFGTDAAEVDSLPSAELQERAENFILQHIDMKKWKKSQKSEASDKKVIARDTEHWGEAEAV